MLKSTIFDVAAKAKVSNATVSRALNTPELVTEETRVKVLKAAKELGYKANAFARGLASSKSTQVAIITPDISRASVSEMVKGILSVAENYGYKTILIQSPQDDKYDNLLTDIVSSRVDGVLYLVDEITDIKHKILKELQDTYMIPLVLVNTVSIDDDSLTSIAIDYETAGYEVTKELIKEKRSKIALLTTLKRYPVSILKENGYIKAMKEANLEPMICYTSGNLDSNVKDLTDFFINHQVDGLIGVRDSIAISAMNILSKKGISIPKDVSIYGFQNTRYAILSKLALSCINIPIYEIGAKAMNILTKQMLGEELILENKRIILKHSIIKRETTK